MNRRAFSLVELIIAIFILGIGMISIAALFPAGIKQQEIAEDDVYGPLVAKHAMELLRTRLKQEDFGCFEDFSSDTSINIKTVRDLIPLNALISPSSNTLAPTIAKDWIWKRPGFITFDDPDTLDRDEAAMYDVFSYYKTRIGIGRIGLPSPIPFDMSQLLTDVEYILQPPVKENNLYGIPYNRQIYDEQFDVTKLNYAWIFAPDLDISKNPPVQTIPKSGDGANKGNALREPAVFITQRERYWPMPANAVGLTPTPKYVWDCMFRRFNGRILVGMFVYRVLPANGLKGGNFNENRGQLPIGTPYVSAQVTQAIDLNDKTIPLTVKNYPPIPQWVSRRAPNINLTLNVGDGQLNNPLNKNQPLWGAGGLDAQVGSTIDSSKYSPNRDDCGVPGTGPSNNNLDNPKSLTYSNTWQQPGQWFIDQYNNVHHVIEGRRNDVDGPVILAKPVPRQPYSNALFDIDNRTMVTRIASKTLLATPDSGGDADLGIEDLWFVPPYDANGNQLLPVFACVEEL